MGVLSDHARTHTLGQNIWNHIELTRLHKFPLGVIHAYWPCGMGVSMAAYSQRLSVADYLGQIALFGLGMTLLHSAFCVFNDICDIEFDRRVERTKSRPLVTGAVSVSSAWALFIGFLSATVALLSYTNDTAFWLGIISLPLHMLYPLAKRWLTWPQLMLGIVCSWNVPVAWISIVGDRGSRHEKIAVLFMALGLLCWTVYFDTIYATQDRKDDIKIGIKSTAVFFGDSVRVFNAVLATTFVSCLAMVGVLCGYHAPFFILSCGGAALYLSQQLVGWRVGDERQAGELFKSNGNLGYLIVLGMCVDYHLSVGV
ncbi:UbiA prenyltransferase [Amylostereum chailletii]|nr:UbiA prenyltransferase [Amylostereum chailletii]